MAAAEIATALTSLKTAYDISKALITIRDAVGVQSTVFELQRAILDAQQAAITAREEQAALIERVRELEAQIAKMKEWKRQDSDYQLKAVDTGAFAYVAKPSSEKVEPPHWLCASCYSDMKKSILQDAGPSKDGRKVVWRCPGCKSEIHTHWARTPAALAAQDAAQSTPPNGTGAAAT